MSAEFIKFGEPPPTLGGDVERAVAAALCAGLPDGYLLIGNPSFPTHRSFFYEYDLIIVSPFLCDVLEVKDLVSRVNVYEDRLETDNGFSVQSVFSTASNKSKVLRSKVEKDPFAESDVRVDSRIVLGDKCTRIDYRYSDHKHNRKVMKVEDAIDYYKKSYREKAKKVPPAKLTEIQKKLSNRWQDRARDSGALPQRSRLGRFYIKQMLASGPEFREYVAMDESPCKIETHLKEFPFQPHLAGQELESYLEDISREMQVLRKLRHQYISCVTGHFRTGCSLVQVSDWFDGKAISELWDKFKEANLHEIAPIMIKIVQGLAYCHEKGVFHRNIDAEQILVSGDWDDIRIRGFEIAKDLERSRTVRQIELERRDVRLMPPEVISQQAIHNHGACDIFQLGVLFYRMLEMGLWPFGEDNSVGSTVFRDLTHHEGDAGVGELRSLVRRMTAKNPNERPYPMQSVEAVLKGILQD